MIKRDQPVLSTEVEGAVPFAKGRTSKPSMRFLVGSLTVGNSVSTLLHMAGGIFLARLVAPATLGLFNGIGLVLGYAPFLQLGILNGLNRELPYYIGRGDRKHAEELASAAQAWALAVGGTVCLALLGVAGWQLGKGELRLAAGWFTHAILAVFLFYRVHYLQVTYRTSHDFARLALVGVVDSAIALALLALVAFLGFYGICLRAVLMAAVATAMLFCWRPVRVGPKWNGQHLKHLFVIGAPIFAVGQLYSWWGVANSTLVLRFTGTEGMGLYSIVLMASNTLGLLPVAVTQVVYPRMAEQFGKTESLRDIIRMAKKPILLTSLGLIPVIALAQLLVEPTVRLVVPRYVGAVPAIRWALLIPFVMSFQPINSAFIVVRRQGLYAVAIVVGIAAYFGALMWLIRAQVSLSAFPQAMLVGKGVFMAAALLFLRHLAREARE